MTSTVSEHEPLSVIVLCTGNSARSHLGEALIRMGGGDKVKVYSAGSKPTGVINPLAIKVMQEIGYDMSVYGHRSKHLSEFDGCNIDVLITVCGNADQRERFHWGFDDPSHVVGTDEEKLKAFRRTRDLMRPLFEAYGRDLADGNTTPSFPYTFVAL